MTTMTAAPTAPSVRTRQNSRVAASQRATAPGGAASTASGTGTRAMAIGYVSPVPDARVDPRVADVHQEVHHDEHAGHEHDHRLDERVVTVRDRLHEEQPEAVEVEAPLRGDEADDAER